MPIKGKSKEFLTAKAAIENLITTDKFPEGIYPLNLAAFLDLGICSQVFRKVANELLAEGTLFKAVKGVREARKLYSSAELRDEADEEFVPGPQSVKFRNVDHVVKDGKLVKIPTRNLPDNLRLWLVDLQCLANQNPTYRNGYGLSR